MKKEKTHESTPIFKGDLKSFNDFIGPRLRNIIPSLTKKYKRKIGKCEHCGITNIEFDAAHKHDFNRKKIIQKILSDSRVNDVEYEVDLTDFEEKYRLEHLPISKVILVLCKSCHTSYDNNRNNLTALNKVVNSNIKTNNVSQPRKENKKQNKTNVGLKVGKFVKNKMEELIKNDLLSDKEIINLQRKDYSREKLHIQYPLLRKVLPNDLNKIDRYWVKKYIIKGKKYLICSEWYEKPNNNDKPHFLNWYRKIVKTIPSNEIQ